MASQADVLLRCLQEAAKAAKPALERCIDHAVAALQVAETQSLKISERDDLALAWRELLRHRDGWCAQYPGALLAAFSQPAKPAARPVAARTPVPALAGADMFSLVDDTQVEEGIESSRLLQQVAPMVEQVLAELDGLMSSAQGLANVRAQANPVRPEVYAQTLRTLLLDAPVAPTISTLWIKHLGEPLGRELKRLYERLINELELAKVRAASYRVLQTPASAGKKPGSAAAGTLAGDKPGAGPGAQGGPVGIGYASDEPFTRVPSHYADLSNYEVKDALFQDFLFRGGSNADHGLAPAYYATIEEELIALKGTPDSAQAALQAEPGPADTGTTGDDDRSYRGTRSDPRRPALPAQDADEGPDSPSRIVDVLSQLSSQVWGVYGRARERALVRTQLRKDATRVGQVLGMEVVKKLVNQVAQDPRLLVPVREAIVALEPSLLRLAMVDSRFFSEESHPGRRLMERVAQRSFKYNDEHNPAFDVFFHALTEAFNGLNALEIEDARPFGAALAELQALWDEQDQHERDLRGNMRQTMQLAEERQAQADQIALDMSLRADLDHVPGVVLDFLFGPWALVMAHARLTDTARQIDPQGYGSLVTDLLWSVKREATLKRPGKLIAMIPGLLGKLHAGLASLGLDPGETEAFFDAMERLHRPVLKLRRVRSRRDAVESDNAPLEVALAETDLSDLSDLLPATPEQRKAKAAGQPWLAPQELDRAGFEDTLPSGPAALSATPEDDTPVHAVPDSGAGDTPADAAGEGGRQPEDILMGLREGSWVDLYSRRHWLRAQLIWASTRGTLFMFVSHGGQPHSMTKRSCERLIRDRLLRPVQTHGVVAHALDHLVKEATPVDPQGRAA
ncbi:MAG: DUF1631 family protein [Polaromonas sp.]|uniref:DUF1631 family protein n=1 Tax=Polaromonas sp. TaxID=1869339 RepID=UPI002730232B|nr:DUF1631 family protein [Polaromonas sp.]MDP2449825.1 DUF1631 family protein [Polaromonas sp.]MDP3246317.1 DUF1631 family protein [Polaromonas sp.]